MKSAKSEIKYVHMPDRRPSEALSRTTPARQATRARTPAPKPSDVQVAARGKPGRPADPDPDRVLEAYEQGRRAFQELSALHADVQAENDGALRRLDRLEQDLRREREQSTRYAAQIASQEQELRKIKEGKRAAEELNSKLGARLSARPSGEPAGLRSELDKARTERDQAQAKKDQLKAERDQAQAKKEQLKAERDQARAERDQIRTERDRLRADKDQTRTERDQLRQRVRSYAEIVDHAERAMGICAKVCAAHAPETSRDIEDTQKTLRDFQASMRP